jgi:outer membrane protein assembly factor BamB
MVTGMNIKNGLICLSIVAILMLCVPNVAVATTGNYPATIHSNARHTGDQTPKARSSTSNGILNWNYVTQGNLTSSVTPNGIVYVGSYDHDVCALNATTGTKIWNYAIEGAVYFSLTVVNGIR